MRKREIIDRKFSRAFEGYDIAEVDFFLDELYREFSLMENEIESLRAQLEGFEAAHASKAAPPLLAQTAQGADNDMAQNAPDIPNPDEDTEACCFLQEDETAFLLQDGEERD